MTQTDLTNEDAITSLSVTEAATLTTADVLSRLKADSGGLSSAEATARRARVGPNALRTHHARALGVLVRQLGSPLLALLVVTATISFFVGERSDAVIIGVILVASVGLGFVNEYRAERAAEALHSQIRHRVVVARDGTWTSLDVVDLVPGDVVRLELGEVVPADVRLSSANDLECDEAVLTGESVAVEKTPEPVARSGSLGDLTACAFMGTVVTSGTGEGVVVTTGGRTQFGRIALQLGDRHPDTDFQTGLRRFSSLLVKVAAALTAAVLVVNVALDRPVIDAVLFSLAIAVGITPQLLPAVVTASLATGSRRLAEKRVLVKRLVCIEDLGNIDLLFTDKTGTLTAGHTTFERAVDPAGAPSDQLVTLGLACNEATIEHGMPVGGNPLDVALWRAVTDSARIVPFRRIAILPFDHNRRRVTALIEDERGERLLVTKGAPEAVLDRCEDLPAAARPTLDALFADGLRVVAVATRPAPDGDVVRPTDERGLTLSGFLVFADPAKLDAAAALQRLSSLGIDVKLVTGDNPRVAETVCRAIGLDVAATLTGHELDALDDESLAARIPGTTIFARVSPDQKARIIRVRRQRAGDVAFLGDGVNDAVALHTADVGISVESATDVAKDAADVILLDKDLGVLADGVVEGRRTFANTMKYVLMGTSSNFGNMFSAAAASAFLPFLPMLPSQILLNNLLYDASQMTIPTDSVDPELTATPSHWDLSLIRHFMLFFGPISSLFDFLTFAIMVVVFDAGARLFHAGWFVESLATQTLVIFVIRTRRVPFFRSRPSRVLLGAVLACVALGAVLPASPIGPPLGFVGLPSVFFLALAGMVIAYLSLVELAKRRFFRAPEPVRARPRPPSRQRRVHRRAARFTHGRSPLQAARPPR